MIRQLFVELAPGMVCVGAMVLLVTYAVGQFLFLPMYETSVLFRPNSRFRISDLIILAAHLQVGVAATLAIVPSEPAIRVGSSLFVGGIVICWWVLGVRMLARSGIEYTWHRWLFLALIMPLGYLSCLLLPVSFFLLPAAGSVLARGMIDRDMGGIAGGLCLLGAAPLLVGSVYFCRRSSAGIRDRAREDRARRDGIEFLSEATRLATARPVEAADREGIDWMESTPARLPPQDEQDVR